MSLSYTVGSNTRTKNPSRNRRNQGRNRSILDVNPPSTRTTHTLPDRGASVSNITPQKSTNRAGCDYPGAEQTGDFGSKPRIVTLSDLKRNELTGGGAKPTNSQRTKESAAAASPTKSKPGIERTLGKTKPVQRSCSTSFSNTNSRPTQSRAGNNLHTAASFKSSQTSASSGKMWEESPRNSQRPPVTTGRPVLVGRPERREMPPETSPNNTHQPSPGEPVYNAQGGYTRIDPNPRKREKIQKQASSELQRLDQYKQRQRVSHVSTRPAAVGGGRISEEEARRRAQREQQAKKYEMIRKREQWAREKKEREDREFEEKKAKAREQAERNKRRREQEQRRREREMASDHRRANEGFLRRFEAQAREAYYSNST